MPDYSAPARAGGGGSSITGFAPANPAPTVSQILVMAGLGATIAFTPTTTGKVVVRISATGTALTGVANFSVAGQFGTGAPPANGAALTGTAFPQGTLSLRPGNLSSSAYFELVAVIAGLTLGTPVWFDAAFLTATAADAAQLANIVATIQEVS